jgi:hypothetical protein
MDEREGALGRAIDALRALPDVRSEATARLLIAVAAERQREREAASGRMRRRSRGPAWIAVASAAAVVLGISRIPAVRAVESSAQVGKTALPAHSVPAVPVSSAADLTNSPRSVQLVLSAPGARTVRVVGDFNGWNDRQSPMARDDASGLWNVRLMLRPGRHVYAFVVNDTQWVRDPRAAAAPDADFGRPGSVLLVGRP